MATEKRLIDVCAEIRKIEDVLAKRKEQAGSFTYKVIEAVKTALEKAPTVDAVEVVRCKDCRFRKSTFNGDGYFCSVWDTDDYEEAYVKDNDFCSYGERRTDGR